MELEMWLFILLWAILETAFLPAPTEVVIVPLVASQHLDPLTVGVVGTVGSVVGAFIDYALGQRSFALIDSHFNITKKVNRFTERFSRIARYGYPVLLVLGRAFPLGTLKPLMLVCGATRYDLKAYTFLIIGSSFIRYIAAATIGSLLAYILHVMGL